MRWWGATACRIASVLEDPVSGRYQSCPPSAGPRNAPRIDERFVPPCKLEERRLRQRSVIIGTAEAPWPCPGISGSQRELEILRERPFGMRHAGRMPARAVAGKLAEHHALAHAKRRHRLAEHVSIVLRMLQIWI